MRTLVALALAAGAAAQDGALIELDGSGTTNPSKYFWEVGSIFMARAKPAVRVTYRAVGSSTGQYEFMGNTDEDPLAVNAHNGGAYNDFGSGDMPFPKDKYDAMRSAGVEVLHVPFALGAMAFFDNVPADYQPDNGLKLTACVLADIFSGVITTWDDAAILEIQDGDFDPPSGEKIVVYHRTYGSSTTKGITQYLHAACPDKWPESKVGSKIDWPSSTFNVEGSGQMSAMISETEWSIGYIDSGHGIEDGLHEIALQNKDGNYWTTSASIAQGGVQSAAEEALKTGVMPDDPAADFSHVSLHNMPGETTWPIVAISYMYIREDQTGNNKKGPLLKAWVEFVLSERGQDLVKAYNFQPVPADVLEMAQKAIGMMKTDDEPEWTFEYDTDKGDGQLDYVISAKRRHYYEYALDVQSDLIGDGDEAGDQIDGEHDHGWGSVEKEDFDALMKRVTDLETENRALKKEVEQMESRLDAVDTTCEAGCDQAMRDLGYSGGSKKGAKKSDVEKAGAVAIAGLIAALVALAVAATACCRVNKLVSNRSSMEAAKDCVPTSGRKEPLAVQGDSYTPSTRH